ncbi:MAG: histidine kinase [Proteobacteria bacterium]|nr:histidine kinase [Pseudomonadota bacterium]
MATLAVYALDQATNGLGVAWRDRTLGRWLASLGAGFVVYLAAAAAALAILGSAFRLAPPAGWRRALVLACAVLLGACAAIVARHGLLALLGIATDDPIGEWRDWLRQVLFEYVAFIGAAALGFEYLYRAERDALRAHAAELDRLALARVAEAARLQLMRAQIEPHFLFNTLATVRWLARTDVTAARAMLADLVVYLEAALPRLRAEANDLGAELALVDAYLGLHQVRMGSRLSFDVRAEPGLARLRMPPAMLLTLVENAIKHGIAPLPHGGHVAVHARIDGESLVIDVQDSGAGFAPVAGPGEGLANVRARLAAEYGPRGRLTLAHARPRGVVASLVLPRAALEAAQP